MMQMSKIDIPTLQQAYDGDNPASTSEVRRWNAESEPNRMSGIESDINGTQSDAGETQRPRRMLRSIARLLPADRGDSSFHRHRRCHARYKDFSTSGRANDRRALSARNRLS